MIHLAHTARQVVETGLPGIRMATAWDDNGTGADFIEFKAGSRFPRHDHEGQEQILMLSGRIRFGDVILSQGDYLAIGPGEEHDAEALEDSVFFLAHVGGTVFTE